jgi:hypothetical protein
VDAGIPAPPTLGVEIDRVGRPFVTMLLNHGFDQPGPMVNVARDAWNADAYDMGWVSFWSGTISASLAVLDGFDGVCGNQAFAGTLGPGRYVPLADVVADDRLWLNSAGTVSTTYLGVEFNAVGLLPNTDVGGRKLNYDSVDTMLSLFIVGRLTGVGDGVSPDIDTQGTTFPYLAAPH